ncbi:MAG TPA: hypothetical protein ENJ82_16570 [Bacteroidetes bacterium]|nr:hypothetical protein [Bacteroidota bacterium]
MLKRNDVMNRMVLTLLILTISITCQRNKLPFSVEEPQYYTSHEFEWTADTLAPPDAYQVFLYDIWGTDENNVWAVGHSDLNRYQIWHWDGETWKNVVPDVKGPRASYYEIFGFSENDFWIVGYTSVDNGYVLHYDGSWRRLDNNELTLCMSVWGTFSQNIFIGGNKGIIYRYNGEKFTRYETGRNLQIIAIWGLASDEIFAIGVNNDNQPADPPIRYLFKYKPDQFILIDSVIFKPNMEKTIGIDLWGIDINNLYSPTGNSLVKYKNGQWVTQFNAPLWRVFGSSPHNIFTGGYGGIFYHYNGVNWQRLHFNDSVKESIWGMWCNDNYVFVIQDLGYYARIWRGKQKGKIRR